MGENEVSSISVRQAVRRYGEFTAVDTVSFEIPRGQIVGLLGHNGAGKTTILKMITGFLAPSSGEIIVHGFNIDSDRQRAQSEIGYLPENCPVYPDMTVIDYLDYMARLRGMTKQERYRSVGLAIHRTYLKEKAASPIGTLSKGLRQRVGIAQAIIHRPKIVVLDEPTSGLDPEQIREIRSLIRELSTSSTIVISTHILQEVQAVCDRVIIIMRGKMVLDAMLSDLQQSNQIRLAVALDANVDLDQQLAKFGSVTREPSEPASRLREYTIGTNSEVSLVIPELAQFVLNSGYQLVAVHPKQRDLEAVFREISDRGNNNIGNGESG